MSGPAAYLSPQQLETLLNGPAGQPPPGVIPNFDDPPNINGLVILTLTICLVFATLAVLMRTYTKLFLIRSWDYEDCKLFSNLYSPRSIPQLMTFRCDHSGMGKLSLHSNITLPPALNLVASSNRTSRSLKPDHQRWRWSSHMEHTVEHVLKATLCLDPHIQDFMHERLTTSPGCQRSFHHLQCHRFLHQALDPPPVLASLRP